MSLKLHVVGLTDIEILELEELSREPIHRVQADSRTGAAHGDLGLTIAVVVVTTAAVHGLAVWLAKRRVTSLSESKLEFEKLPDGTIRLKLSEVSHGTLSESPSSQVVTALKAELSSALAMNGSVEG
jgi:hypothetical protein